MKKKIIAASTHPGAINAILPVIEKLTEEGKIDISIIGYKYSEKILSDKKINYKTIKDYSLNNISVESMYNLLQKESPNFVLTGASSPNKEDNELIEQTMTLAARKTNAKSLAVLDFLGDCYQRFSDFNDTKKGKFKYLPDKIAILDKLCEEIMLKEGFPKEKLVITGNPYFDALIKLKNEFKEEDKQKIRKDIGIDMNAYLFSYFSQPIEKQCGNKYGYTERDVLKELLESFKNIQTDKKFGIIIKVHPREDKSSLEKITQGYTLPFVLDQNSIPRQVILASDAVISPWSITLLESTYLEKPSISLQPGLNSEKNDPLITNKLGVTLPVYKHGEIKPILERLLNDKNYNTELSEMGKRKGFSIDGKATERATNLVYEMLGIK